MTVPLRLVLVPALLTLAVTLVRLVGELCGWSPRFFSTAPGGFAWFGISWLMPVFGFWFGLRLARTGHRPARPVRALLLHLVSFAACIAGFQFVIHVLAFDTSRREGLVAQLLCMGVASALGAVPALVAWPRLFVVDFVYALLARIPVVVITWLAIYGAWGTHYEKLGPTDYAGFAPPEHAAWLSFAQLVFWPAFTVAIGGAFGSLAALVVRQHAAPGAAAIDR
jgi:hypothetical protein